MAKIFWDQIKEGLPGAGKYLTGTLSVEGALNITGSLNTSGSLYINGDNILDLIENSSSIFRQTGSYWNTTRDLQITGSLYIDLDNTAEEFVVSVAGEDKVKVNNEGTLQLVSQSVAPSPVPGGIYYNDSDDFYFGFST